MTRVSIVGAGIGGLATALALRRAGIDARIHEQAAELGEVGAGLSVTPNAVKALDWLGVGAQVRAIADEPPQQLTCHYASGELLVGFDRSNTVQQYGAPYLQLHRADLHRILLEQVLREDPNAVVADRRLVSVDFAAAAATAAGTDAAAGRIRLGFLDAAGQRHEESASAVVGADGLKSVVRAAVCPSTPPTFGGFVAWRGLVPRPALGSLDLSAGSKVFAGPGRLFVRYPVRQGSVINYVVFARADAWQREGWSQTGEVGEAMAMLEGFHPEVHAILAATPGGRCHKWGLFAREPLPCWARGPLVLVGDAAHPMMPWFGQGAASALEDAVVLGRCLEATSDLAAAFRRYEATRHARVTLIHRESALGGERLSGLHPQRLREMPVRNEDSLGLFSYDPATEPLAIDDSAGSAGVKEHE